MDGNHYLYIGSPWLLNNLFPEMGKDEFRRELSRIQPLNMNLIAHELGHLVTGHVAGNTCTQLSLIPDPSNHYKSDAYVDFLNPPGNLQETLKEMVIRSAGLAGSLQILSTKEKENPEVCQQLLTNASQDVEDMYELLKEAGDQGWLDSEAMQLPLIDFDTQMQVKEKMLNTTLGQPERDDMNAHLDSFVRKYSKTNGKALYEKGKPFKRTEQWNATLNQTTSLYGTF